MVTNHVMGSTFAVTLLWRGGDLKDVFDVFRLQHL